MFEKLILLIKQIEDGPLKALAQKIESKELLPDEHQVKIAHDLQRIYDEIQSYQPPEPTIAGGFFSKLLGSKPKLDQSERLKGLYIYGSVGGGKTLLMDMFYECCTKVSDLDITSDSFYTNCTNFRFRKRNVRTLIPS